MLSKRPRYSKYKRPFNKKVKKNIVTHSQISSKIAYGSFGIKILETCKLQYYFVETMRRALVRLCKFNSKIWFRLFFDTPLTSKPLEARMGKGKGKLKHYVCLVKRGSFILEVDNLVTWKAIASLHLCVKKLPVKTAIFLKI